MISGSDVAWERTQPKVSNTMEISLKGTWVRVPTLEVEDKSIVVTGRIVRRAVVHDEEWLQSDLKDPENCIRQLKQQRSDALYADIFTFSQKLPITTPRFSYHLEWDSVAAIRLISFKDWWEKLPQETRKNVRRAQKRGVVVRVTPFDDQLVKGIVEVNNDTPVRQNVRFAHYGKTFEQVKKDHSAFVDRSDFICAYVGDELTGFLKIVYRGDIASILQLLPKSSHSDKRPANALVARAVELCEAKGISHLTYGMFNYGNKGDSPLREFKVRNGFEEILVPRYYVPLTKWGKTCMKLNLHRGLHGILPHRVITIGVNLRARLYDLQRRTGRCSSMPEQPNSIRQTECSNPPAGSNT